MLAHLSRHRTPREKRLLGAAILPPLFFAMQRQGETVKIPKIPAIFPVKSKKIPKLLLTNGVQGRIITIIKTMSHGLLCPVPRLPGHIRREGK